MDDLYSNGEEGGCRWPWRSDFIEPITAELGGGGGEGDKGFMPVPDFPQPSSSILKN